ncbi:MAG TPA: response regulator [Candidatus Krumholzibacteria bacterium]|nr:response regulator [Candidatus Krumholzibacteria bacterium]
MSAARGDKHGWSKREESSADPLAELIHLSRRTTHEVSNALTAVLGYLDLVSGQLKEQDAVRDAIAKAIEAAHAAASTIHGFSEEILRYTESGESTPPFAGNLSSRGTTTTATGPESDAVVEVATGAGTTGLVLFAVADTFIRSILLTGLKAAGHEIFVASELQEFLRLCAEYESRQPVLVVDSAIDGMGNGKGAARIRAEYPSLPVILMSTGAKELTGIEESPMLTVIHKPFPIARLLEEITRCRCENGDESK